MAQATCLKPSDSKKPTKKYMGKTKKETSENKGQLNKNGFEHVEVKEEMVLPSGYTFDELIALFRNLINLELESLYDNDPEITKKLNELKLKLEKIHAVSCDNNEEDETVCIDCIDEFEKKVKNLLSY